MIVTSIAAPRPGARINDYRNSEPRCVKLLAIGTDSEQLVRALGEQKRNNVLFSAAHHPACLQALDEPVDGIKPDAVIIVYQDGEGLKLPFPMERTASMLSFVILEAEGGSSRGSREGLRSLAGIADLCVATSDPDFVTELIVNLTR